MVKKMTNDRPSRPDEDNPEWTKKDFARARPAADALPEFIGEKATQELMRRRRGRPPKADRKVNQTLRHFQSGFSRFPKRYQTRGGAKARGAHRRRCSVHLKVVIIPAAKISRISDHLVKLILRGGCDARVRIGAHLHGQRLGGIDMCPDIVKQITIVASRFAVMDQVFNALCVLHYDFIFAFLYVGKCEPNSRRLHAKVGGVLHLLVDMRRHQQLLGRDASAQSTGAT